MKLTVIQERFVAAYLITADAVSSAVTAGYSQEGAAENGEKLLKLPHITEALSAARGTVARQHDITLAEVVRNARKLVKLGSTPMSISSRGGTKYDLDAMAAGNDQLIRLAGLYKESNKELPGAININLVMGGQRALNSAEVIDATCD